MLLIVSYTNNKNGERYIESKRKDQHSQNKKKDI